MKAVFFTKYSRKGASSRVRTLQYLPYLESKGINCTVKPLFNDQYLKELYEEGQPGKWNILCCYLKRLIALTEVFKFNVIIVEKELFPYFPAIFEWFFHLLKLRWAVDFDDAIFHNYDLHPNRWVRVFFKDKINYIMSLASMVTVGNEYLKQRALNAGAKNVFYLPTVINTDVYKTNNKKCNDKVVIGWIGSPSTVQYLKITKNIIKKLKARYSVQMIVIGADLTQKPGWEDFTFVPWSEEKELELIQMMDIGIMPLENTPWEKGKCGYKLIQYMGCGIAVVGSSIGKNDMLIKQATNGFKADTEEEWFNALETLILFPALRKRSGQAGREIVEQQYSLKKFEPIYYECLSLLHQNRL